MNNQRELKDLYYHQDYLHRVLEALADYIASFEGEEDKVLLKAHEYLIAKFKRVEKLIEELEGTSDQEE